MPGLADLYGSWVFKNYHPDEVLETWRYSRGKSGLLNIKQCIFDAHLCVKHLPRVQKAEKPGMCLILRFSSPKQSSVIGHPWVCGAWFDLLSSRVQLKHTQVKWKRNNSSCKCNCNRGVCSSVASIVAMVMLQSTAIAPGVVKVTNFIPYLWILIPLPYKYSH